MALSDWTKSYPIYVTNKTASGDIMSYNMNAMLSIPLLMLAVLNGLAWGIIGLVVAVKVVL